MTLKQKLHARWIAGLMLMVAVAAPGLSHSASVEAAEIEAERAAIIAALNERHAALKKRIAEMDGDGGR